MLPPMKPSTTLSSSSCRTTRQRVAPSAMRTAISRARCAERESSRLATFAQAMSSTKHDGAHHREEHDSAGAADEPFGERFHADADEVLVRVRVCGRKLLCDAVQFRLRLARGARRPQAAEHAERTGIPPLLGCRSE